MERISVGDLSEVCVGRGVLGKVVPERNDREQILVLAQPGVPETVAAAIAEGFDVPYEVVVVPDRDAVKDLEQVGSIYDVAMGRGLGRHDTIVGVGGGAVTDAAGFVAATWMRGIESLLVPTTLLAAVDAAIGGKTAINRGGKNLVGAFWHPRRVTVDLDLLATLPAPLAIEGHAEIIKAGFIADTSILDEYRRHPTDPSLDVVVPAAIRVKADVVAEDAHEHGRRAILNFGHTVGHAVEVLGSLPHGHAVAVGMVAEAVLSNLRHGYDNDALTALLFSVGLPVAAAGIPLEPARDLIAVDKKRTRDGVRMVLLRADGDPVVEVISPDEIELALRAIGGI